MNGWWYIVFGLLGVAIPGAVLWIIFGVRYNKYDVICHRAKWGTKEYYTARDKRDACSTPCETGTVICCTGLVLAFFTTLIALFNPLACRFEVNRFKYQSKYVETAVENGEILENIAITQTIIDQNKWLARAKSCLDTYGIFSGYYNSGLEDLDPIMIERD